MKRNEEKGEIIKKEKTIYVYHIYFFLKRTYWRCLKNYLHAFSVNFTGSFPKLQRTCGIMCKICKKACKFFIKKAKCWYVTLIRYCMCMTQVYDKKELILILMFNIFHMQNIQHVKYIYNDRTILLIRLISFVTFPCSTSSDNVIQ